MCRAGKFKVEVESVLLSGERLKKRLLKVERKLPSSFEEYFDSVFQHQMIRGPVLISECHNEET